MLIAPAHRWSAGAGGINRVRRHAAGSDAGRSPQSVRLQSGWWILIGHRQPGGSFLHRDRESQGLLRPEGLHSVSRHHRAGRTARRIIRAIALAAWVGRCSDLGRQFRRSVVDRGPYEGHGKQKRQKGSGQPRHSDRMTWRTDFGNTRPVEWISLDAAFPGPEAELSSDCPPHAKSPLPRHLADQTSSF